MEEARLRQRLAALLPRSVWPLVEGRAEGRRTEGTVLFADLAGFTALTENLARIGKEGAEELTRILNAFFSAQIGVVHAAGGDVLRFGGDAVTVFFEREPEVALEAARAMQASAEAFREVATRGGVFSLAMKIGVARGPVLLGIVGDEMSGRDYFAAGRALDEAADAEHRAERGQVVLGPSLQREARRLGYPIRDLKGDFVLVEGPPPMAPPRCPWRSPAELPSLHALQAFLPPFAVEKARLEEGLWAAEHRWTTVFFLSFSGLDYDGDPQVLAKLDGVYTRIAAVVSHYGGTVNKVDMGDKGSKAIALFGAPKALEQSEEAACRAALELLEDPTLRGSLTKMQAGITSAPLFAGWVGSEERREFTVMGDGINMAARLMANAFSWRALSDVQVRRKAGNAIAFRPLDPIFVKGKTEKVPVFRPLGDLEEAREETRAFIGRQKLLDDLKRLLFAPDGPFALAVTGGPGVGKSAFLHRLTSLLEGEGIRHYTVPLSPHSAHGYLSAVRPVFFAALGVSRQAPPSIKVSALEAALPPEDQTYFSLLSPLLGVALPETDQARALSPKERKDLLFALLQRLLRRLVAGSPYLLALDGLENADGASLEFLGGLLEAPPSEPLKLLLVFREGKDPCERLLPKGLQWRLPPFREEEIRDFLTRAAGLAPPPEGFVAFLSAKTGGTAQFLDQLVRTLKEQGLLRLGAGGLWEVDEDRLATARFPDTLEGLLLSRLERLPEVNRLLLKTAAVLGSSFSVNLLAHLLNRPLETVLAEVRNLEREGFVRMDSWGTRPYAAFTDVLLRDALYESLNFESRRALHRRVARYLEADSGEDRRVWPALARHFEAAGETEPALRYLSLCTEEALGRYDNTAAFDFLTRFAALKEAEGASLHADPAYRRALMHLAESAKDLGRLEETEALSRKILEGVREPCEEAVVSLMRIADLERRRGNLERSLDLDEEAMERSSPLSDPVLNCRILLDSGVGQAMAGRFEEALTRFKKAERLARKAGTPNWQVLALMNQGLCRYFGGKALAEAASLLRRADRLAKKNNLMPQAVNIAVNLSQVLLEFGAYKEALRIALERGAQAKQFGYRTLHLFLTSNGALALAMLGRWESAKELTDAAHRDAARYGIRALTAATLHTLGILEAVSGNWKGAYERQNQAMDHYLAQNRTDGVQACWGEVLSIENELRMTQDLLPVHRDGPWAEPGPMVSQSLHGLAFEAQRTLRDFRTHRIPLSKAREFLDKALRRAERQGIHWLRAELAEIQIRILLESGKPEEASVAGLAVYPQVIGQWSPLKTGAFLLALGECLREAGHRKALAGVLWRLASYGRCFDRGLLGLRYRLLRAEAAADEGRLRSACYHARAAGKITGALEALQTDGLFPEAFRALPEMARLRALEGRLGLPGEGLTKP